MATPSTASTPCPGSPDITTLAYRVLFDISGGVPSITISNLSTIVNYNHLTWWFVITTPSGTPIHVGSLSSPDYSLVNWSEYTIPTNSWPTPGGTPPFSQIEFTTGLPYTCTVYVQDSQPEIYSLAVSTVICRPNGNTANSKGNFGAATVLISTNCANGIITTSDTTNYTYQNLLGASFSNSWSLVYPADSNLNLPAPATAQNTPNVNFYVGYSGTGYNLTLKSYSLYDFGNGTSVKVQYRFQNAFAVNCNISLCDINCGIQNLRAATERGRGQIENTKLEARLAKITDVMANTIIPGILQPTCGIDVPGAIQYVIKLLEGYTANCGCNEGINQQNPSPSPSLVVVSVNVPIYVATVGAPRTKVPAPTGFPGATYFPTQLYDSGANFLLGPCMDMDDLITILNTQTGWTQYGTFFNQGLGEVGCYPVSPATSVPPIYITDGLGTGAWGNETPFQGNETYYLVPLYSIQSYPAPASTSNQILVPPNSFPSNYWVNMNGTLTYLGSQTSLVNLITALNAVMSGMVDFYAAASKLGTINIAVVVNQSSYSGGNNIQIYTDATDNSLILFGGNHKNMVSTPPAVGGETGIGLAVSGIVGNILGPSTSNVMWATTKIENYLFGAQSDTGLVYMWDMANPLQPLAARTYQLPQVTGAPAVNFSGLPNVGGVPSYYSLYFPTDYNFPPNNNISSFLWEAVTGSAWGTALTGSISPGFHLTSLIGKCPRCVINNVVYFTQDGSLESDTSQSSGVANGYIVVCTNYSNPLTSGNYTTVNLLPSGVGAQPEQIWAAAFDGVNTIYFVGEKGSIVTYNTNTNSIIATYVGVLATGISGGITFPGAGSRMNAKYYLGKLYVSTFGMVAGAPLSNTGTFVLDTTTLGGTPSIIPFTPFVTSSGFNKQHFNVLPYDNLIFLTYNDANGSKYGLVAMFNLEGQFLGLLPNNTITGGGIFNLIPLKTKSNVYSPTTL